MFKGLWHDKVLKIDKGFCCKSCFLENCLVRAQSIEIAGNRHVCNDLTCPNDSQGTRSDI